MRREKTQNSAVALQPRMGSGRATGKILTPRRAATRARLIAAARELFAERGISGTSVEEISERAGFTRGAFYSNFDDIYDILSEVSAAEFASLEQGLESAWEALIAAGKPLYSSLEQMTTDLLAAIPVGREFYLVQAELAIQMVRQPQLRAKLAAPRESFLQRFTEFLINVLESCGLQMRAEPRAVSEMVVALLRDASETALISGRTHNLIDPSKQARDLIPVLITAVTEPVRS